MCIAVLLATLDEARDGGASSADAEWPVPRARRVGRGYGRLSVGATTVGTLRAMATPAAAPPTHRVTLASA